MSLYPDAKVEGKSSSKEKRGNFKVIIAKAGDKESVLNVNIYADEEFTEFKTKLKEIVG